MWARSTAGSRRRRPVVSFEDVAAVPLVVCGPRHHQWGDHYERCEQRVEDGDACHESELLERDQRAEEQHAEAEHGGERRADERCTGCRECRGRCRDHGGTVVELFGESVDDVQRVVDADPDRQRRDERGHHVVGDPEESHRTQHPDEDEHDREHCDDGQERSDLGRTEEDHQCMQDVDAYFEAFQGAFLEEKQ